MARKLMKEGFDSYFETGKLYPQTIRDPNILGQKCNEKVMEVCRLGLKTKMSLRHKTRAFVLRARDFGSDFTAFCTISIKTLMKLS